MVRFVVHITGMLEVSASALPPNPCASPGGPTFTPTYPPNKPADTETTQDMQPGTIDTGEGCLLLLLVDKIIEGIIILFSNHDSLYLSTFSV